MGYATEIQERVYRRGFALVDGSVCNECVDDEAIKAFIAGNAVDDTCTFCGRTGDEPIAAVADDVIDLISDGIKYEHTRVENELYRDEGEWIGGSSGTVELLEETLWAPLGGGPFAEAVYNAAGDDEWCERDYYAAKPHEQLSYGWELFVGTVKHEARFMFLLLEQRPERADVMAGHPVRRGGAILTEIAEMIDKIGLVESLPAGTRVYRCRARSDGVTYTAAKDLGTPPAQQAQANRMSPAGIAMFYGAFDDATAIAETAEPGDTVASLGLFETGAAASVVNLDRLPDVPSVFDQDRRHLRSPLRFLHGFREDLVKAIERDGQEHIEYVPTQVVTEYLRLIYRQPDAEGNRLDGLVFTSSKNAGRCVVLFVDNAACLEPNEAVSNDRLQMRLLDVTTRALP